MAKATLLQRLLNNPSQSYSFPPEKDYHSTKHSLLKAVEATVAEDSKDRIARTNAAYIDDAIRFKSYGETENLPLRSHQGLHHPQQQVLRWDLEVSGDDNDSEEFLTPRSSFYSDSSIPSPSPVPPPSFQVTHPTPPIIQDDSSGNSFESMSLRDESWSESTESAETLSLFSSHTTSTRATTPVNSDSDHSKPAVFSGRITAVTVASATSHVSSQTLSKRSSRKSTYTDEDWARDVRWLVPPDLQKSSKSRRTMSESSIVVRAAPLPMLLPDHPIPTRSRKGTKSKSRMTAVLEEDEGEDAVSPSTNRTLHHNPEQLSVRVLSSHSGSQGRRSSRSSKSKSRSPSRSYRTVELPSHLSGISTMPSRGTTPYSSLTLPRASTLPPSHAIYSKSVRSSTMFSGSANMFDRLKIEDPGKIDLTKDGMASTTMATVEIVKGVADSSRGRRSSRSFALKQRGIGDNRSHSPTPSHLLSSLPSPLGFCSRTPPPSYVPQSHVLVQVWAVGLDGRDEIVVKKEKTGFVPGRSFVGRVVETGWDVSDDAVRKSEWVVGLVDLKKCGALAEFIVVDRRRIHRVPQPASVDLPASATSPLNVQELALLPLCGVFAYRAFKTFEPAINSDGSNGPFPLKPKRILVLEGQDGTGALVVRMLAKRGWNVVVQVSLECIASSRKTLATVERRLKSWGVEEVCPGDPLTVLKRLLERHKLEGYVVDGILDTIGGQEIWTISQMVLQRLSNTPPAFSSPDMEDSDLVDRPQFTTLVGDRQDRPIPTAQDHFKAGLRSLKRAMNGGEGSCGYAWISAAADIDSDGMDVRHSLNGIIKWVEETRGEVKPWVGEEDDMDAERRSMGMDRRVVVFEMTPQVFGGAGQQLFKCGGTVVVKVVG